MALRALRLELRRRGPMTRAAAAEVVRRELRPLSSYQAGEMLRELGALGPIERLPATECTRVCRLLRRAHRARGGHSIPLGEATKILSAALGRAISAAEATQLCAIWAPAQASRWRSPSTRAPGEDYWVALDRDVRITHLLAAGLLPQIISDELDVPRKAVTEIRKKMRLPPKPGRRPTTKKLLEKPRAVLTGSILIHQYQRATAGETGAAKIDLDALVGIYTALSHTSLARAGVILRHTSLTHAWVLLRAFNAGRVVMRDCSNRDCPKEYPVIPDYPSPGCPFCQKELFNPDEAWKT